MNEELSFWCNQLLEPTYNTLCSRINNDIKRLYKCESLEDTVSVMHSLTHKITECITKGQYKMAVQTYKVLQEATAKFTVPDNIKTC